MQPDICAMLLTMGADCLHACDLVAMQCAARSELVAVAGTASWLQCVCVYYCRT
jgi:hypothetical protein